jgi:hypothetical protein
MPIKNSPQYENIKEIDFIFRPTYINGTNYFNVGTCDKRYRSIPNVSNPYAVAIVFIYVDYNLTNRVSPISGTLARYCKVGKGLTFS